MLPVNVIFAIGWKVIIDYKGDLLDINSSCQQIGSNENPGRSRSEFSHDHVTFLLVHVSVLNGNNNIKLLD